MGDKYTFSLHTLNSVTSVTSFSKALFVSKSLFKIYFIRYDMRGFTVYKCSGGYYIV